MHAVAEPGQHSIHEGGDVGKDLIVRKAKRLKQSEFCVLHHHPPNGLALRAAS